jgi:hypothetical protein
MVTSIRNAPVIRPVAVVTAVLISVIGNTVGAVAFFFLPGSDEIPAAAMVVGTVLAVVAIIAAWGLWNGARWGAIGTVVINALNALSSVPGLFDPPSGQIATGIVISLLLTSILVALIFTPPAHAFWSRGRESSIRQGMTNATS